jgi:hypothetical protein
MKKLYWAVRIKWDEFKSSRKTKDSKIIDLRTEERKNVVRTIEKKFNTVAYIHSITIHADRISVKVVDYIPKKYFKEIKEFVKQFPTVKLYKYYE